MNIPTTKSKNRKRKLIVLSVFLAVIAALILLWPRAPKSPDYVHSVADLEAFMEKLTDFGIPPGISLVVVKNDSMIYSKGFGWADQPRGKHATPETVYHWFSITKIVTAIAILQLYEQGKLQLDDPVSKYLPFFKVQYPSVTSREVTIRHLLNHSSGLPNPMFRLLRWIHYEEDPHINQTSLVKEAFPSYSKLEFEPGEKTKYTNFGYMVLGAVIEKITNMSYEDYIRRYILDPIEMNHTDFVYTKEMEPFEASGSQPVLDITTLFIPLVKGSFIHKISGKNIWFKRFYNDQAPPSALIGPATDAARLAIAYLNNGEMDGKRILSRQMIDTMTNKSHMIIENKDRNAQQERGIGWHVSKGNELILMHTGGGMAFHTMMRLYPEQKLGFILFTNSTKRETWRIIDLAEDLKW